MTRQNLNEVYFDWIYNLVCSDRRFKSVSYRKLLTFLDNTEFSYILSMDGNRAEDGMDLRYRFGYENNIPDYEIAAPLADRPCSILEMMVALSIRCEENIMDNPEIGDRTGQWFWGMIESLGLYSMEDSNFERSKADKIIKRFLNRDYKMNGEGGLFTIPNYRKDLRYVEIWYQAMWYLDEMLEN